MPNHLADATSPYLLQHAGNPVDWQEWGEPAFAEARARDVPILLSVGYAACHWCHVMAHESFEDEQVAAVVNAGFVPVKVDREERPDVDAVYMRATTAMTGQGGWPMTCLLTPDGHAFYCGTYFPRDRFIDLLRAVTEVWRDNRAEVVEGAAGITERLREASRPAGQARTLEESPLGTARLDDALTALVDQADPRHGGFGGAPKFPPSMVLEYLLRHHARTGNPEALDLAEHTCSAMARGGIYDQLAGGFARYSVDAAWVVPHFEKMLADNAQLLRVYLHWYRTTGSALAERVIRETAEFLLRDLRTPEGGFAASLDADTDGEEGLTYVWTPEQLIAALGPEDGARAAAMLGVTEAGTFEGGTSTLRMLDEPPAEWPEWRLRLFEARRLRPQPARDDKVVTSWNGLAIAALAEAGALLEEPSWVAAARQCGELVLTHTTRDGAGRLRLRRASRDGQVGQAWGVADDYGNLAEGVLALHQATGEARWLEVADELLTTALEQFRAPDDSFYDTADDGERLVLRMRGLTDNAEPSGTSALAGALLTFSALTGRRREEAEAALAAGSEVAGQDPRFAGWFLAVAEAAVSGPVQVAVVGDDDIAREMVAVARAATSPGAVLAFDTGAEPTDPGAGNVVAASDPDTGHNRVQSALLTGRGRIDGRSAAYVCRGFVCDLPVVTVEDLRTTLAATTGH
ncbi:thioredoxin domain-containing protein [Ruania halotolerans]|uniref:thioredoxin domain-containing protein n=1 Tax=Ruania halotolerans TaxID=2897773 RepID=UPI001E5FCD51|nr:thioredoxin domain-containing protein [Ruania halotolerans]UFU06944.1 thioredoxin domain-containing protein [Ruania halotolerans]